MPMRRLSILSIGHCWARLRDLISQEMLGRSDPRGLSEEVCLYFGRSEEVDRRIRVRMMPRDSMIVSIFEVEARTEHSPGLKFYVLSATWKCRPWWRRNSRRKKAGIIRQRLTPLCLTLRASRSQRTHGMFRL